MATKKVQAKRANRYTYAFDGGEPYGEESAEASLQSAIDDCGVGEDEIVEVYELVPVGRYKLGGWQKVA